MARAQREHPRDGLRHRIEHCGICPPDLRERVTRQGILPVMQPAFFWEFGDGYIANYGTHRADTMFPAKSLLASGVPVVGSSDAPVTHYAPLFGIVTARLDAGLRDAQRLFLYVAMRGIVSAGVRLGAIGAYRAQQLQAAAAREIDEVIERCGDLDPLDIAQTAPLIDLFQSTHDRLYSRLFQS